MSKRGGRGTRSDFQAHSGTEKLCQADTRRRALGLK